MVGSSSSWCVPPCALALLSVVGCGPHHDDGGTGGAGASGTAATAGSAGQAGSGGVGSGGSANAGAGGVAGTGGAPPNGQGDYDEVIGCGAVSWPVAATFTVLGSMNDRFFPSSLSGDGRVIGGQHDSTPVRWSASSGFIPIADVDGAPIELSCNGDVAAVRAFSDGIYRESAAEGLEYLFGSADTSASPLSLSPDGSTIVGNLDTQENPGPFPVRWTRATGSEPIEPLRNSLVYHTSPDGQSFVGADVLHVYRFQPGLGKMVLFNHAPLAFDGPATMPVSADGSAFAFSTHTTLDSMLVVRGDLTENVNCPVVPCAPIVLSGTGKALLIWVGGAGGSFIWTREHGFRSLGELLQQFGADTQGRIVSAQQMSDDAQAFTGTAADPNNPLDYQGFYATLPAAAYE
jgi:hypothetical protein